MKEFFQIIPYLTCRRILNLFAYSLSIILSKVFRRPVLMNHPYGISIESAATCNFSCAECPLTERKTRRTNTFMSCDTFQQTLSTLMPGTFYLNLYFQGEPLLDPKIDERITVAKKKKLFVSISTNGSLLNKKMATKLIDSGLDKIIISIDATTAKTYEQYRIGGDFDLLMENLDTLVQLKKKKKSKKPLIEAQMLVFAFNEEEIPAFKTIMKEKGANIIRYKSPQFYSAKNAGKDMSNIAKFQRYKKDSDGNVIIENKTQGICKRLWHTILVSSDGVVPICCYDKDVKHPMGDISKQTLGEIWKGKSYMQFRQNYLKGKSANICLNCAK